MSGRLLGLSQKQTLQVIPGKIPISDGLRRVCELAVCILHTAGVWFFYVPEFLRGFPHLKPDYNLAFSFDMIVHMKPSRMTNVLSFIFGLDSGFAASCGLSYR